MILIDRVATGPVPWPFVAVARTIQLVYGRRGAPPRQPPRQSPRQQEADGFFVLNRKPGALPLGDTPNWAGSTSLVAEFPEPGRRPRAAGGGILRIAPGAVKSLKCR